jgi:hypothetical protein
MALGLTVLAVVANRTLGRTTGLALGLALVAWEGLLEYRGARLAASEGKRGVANPPVVD